ncbi:MAG: hypothetical protein NWE92_02565 [Candidatus Bathyarchaeota archaeon]|nr:hypothetical protein [Candidatus Bathyarchaeota archaeon]
MRKKVVCVLALVFAMITQMVTVSAIPTEEWTREYVGTNTERAEALIQCSDGGYLIAGEKKISASSGLQFWLLKTDALGNGEWNKTYGTAGASFASCVIQTSDGGYILAGTANSCAEIIKTDSLGNVEWNRTYEKDTVANWIIQTSDGGYAVAGAKQTKSVSGNIIWNVTDTCWFAKLDSSGAMSWSKTYPGAGLGSSSGVVQAMNGGYAMVGTTENMDFLLIKIDSHGELKWSKNYGTQDKDGGSSILQDPDGSYVMAGLMWNRSTTGGVGLVKTDSEGNLLWLKNFPGSGTPSMMTRANDGDYILCSGMLDKIDTKGNLIWSQNVSLEVPSEYYAVPTGLVTQTDDGGYAVTGTVQNKPANPADMTFYVWLGKIDAEGNPAKFVPEFPVVAALGFAVWVFLVAVIFKITGKTKKSQ